MLLLSSLNPSPLLLPTKTPTLTPIPKPHLHITSSTSDQAALVAQSCIRRISDKLRSLGYIESSTSSSSSSSSTSGTTAGEIFVPTPEKIQANRVGSTLDPSWATSANKKSASSSAPSAAELVLRSDELRRLRGLGIRIEKRFKIGKAGVTEGIVNGIHERWRSSELVKIQCDDLCRMNMKRTHEILERKTGGLVVWRSGSIIILYRGANYKYPYFDEGELGNENPEKTASEEADNEVSDEQHPDMELSIDVHRTKFHPVLVPGVGAPNKVRLQLPGEAEVTEEADKLLDGLGPRFSDWRGCEPLPIDADLLPGIIPGFRRPFRLLPFGIKPKLTDREMTILRRLGMPLPCHFALGRNRNLQGLAASMIKLWEKCEIAKIAIKRGVQNTNFELAVEELKKLTGGTLLSKSEECIVFYRGKDFLPLAVTVEIEKRRKYGNSTFGELNGNEDERSIPTLGVSRLTLSSGASVDKCQEQAGKEIYTTEVRPRADTLPSQKLETKISRVIAKKERAEKLLTELENMANSAKVETSKEAISEEERYMFRKVGLRMKPFLLLGRRGVFDGTIENMHLHWKYRELVKIICKEHRIEDVETTASVLEAESGGILVAVEKISKGHAIIIYRGTNYQRPSRLRPKSLLTKREAMKRSLEAQRRESLKLHVLSLSNNINELKDQMQTKDKPLALSIEMDPEERNGVSERDINSFTDVDEKTGEVHAEYLDSEGPDYDSFGPDETVSAETDSIQSSDPLNDMQMNSTFDENDYDSTEARRQCLTMHRNNAAMNHVIELNEDYLEDGGMSSKPLQAVYESKLERDSDIEVLFKAAPLSNRERLILRKQALKMRKRPVISVARSNNISGVVKTIKTHFKKHPLAIVNIKGRAEGTSVQQLILELEVATGAAFVSKEPNKVILYRGWGAGEKTGGPKEDGTNKSSVKEVMSPQLIAAIRLECGFHSGDGD